MKDEMPSYDSTSPAPKDVKDTKMLEPGARENKERQSGDNVLKRWVGKHPNFGSLGAKGHP